MDEYSQALLDAVDAAVPGWIERLVCDLVVAYRGECSFEVRRRVRAAGQRAAADVHEQLGAFLETDVDEQRTNPLSILRGAVTYATAALKDEQIPEVVRDEFAERAFPDDVYNLVPAGWNDIDVSLQEPGMIWGAWKAKQHLDRRRAEGRM
ncbi:MAG: hypothetical protein AB7L13_00120 [Acidimicrobiia bacterium]